jgi:hypothetical protein
MAVGPLAAILPTDEEAMAPAAVVVSASGAALAIGVSSLHAVMAADT